MTDPVQARSYRRPRRYVFVATLIVIAALFALPFLI
jgi:hypothetical protein